MIKDVVAVVAASGSKQLVELRTVKKIRLDQYKEFCNILQRKYDYKEDEINKNEDYEFDRIIHLGLMEWKKEETGYEIIHNGKTADVRVLKNLGKIAYEILQINTYPKISGFLLRKILNKSLGIKDIRTVKKYRKTILDYCNIDEEIIDKCTDSRLGDLDASRFVKRIPSQYVAGGKV